MDNLFISDELYKLKKLLDEGILTEQEFLSQKEKLLGTNITKKSLVNCCVINEVEYDLTKVATAIDNNDPELASVFKDIVTLQPKEYAALILYYKDNGNFPKEYNTKNGTSAIFKTRNANKTLSCPKCGSTAITTGQRGWKLTTGFLGSNKTVNRCGACGHVWKP